jgi:hypothetical protein
VHLVEAHEHVFLGLWYVPLPHFDPGCLIVFLQVNYYFLLSETSDDLCRASQLELEAFTLGLEEIVELGESGAFYVPMEIEGLGVQNELVGLNLSEDFTDLLLVSA